MPISDSIKHSCTKHLACNQKNETNHKNSKTTKDDEKSTPLFGQKENRYQSHYQTSK